MNEQPASLSPAPPSEAASDEAAFAAPLWHLAWAAGVLAVGAALVAGLGEISWRAALALGLGAAPGAIGYLWRPRGRRQQGLVALWALAAVLAACLTGGATGPLGLWCILPLLAGAMIGPLAEGAVMAGVTVAVALLVQLAGLIPPAPGGGFGTALTAAGLLSGSVAAGAALGILSRRARSQARASAGEHAWLTGVMSELPQLALALDRDGVPEAMFGAPMPGLDVEHLRAGLVEAARPEDRPAVKAALCETLDHGLGEAMFSPAAAPDRRLCVSLRRRAGEGLTALIREAAPVAEVAASAPAPQAAIAAPDVEPEPDTRLADLQRALEAAEIARADAEANASGRARFLANMSHELRTPLNAIMGFSDIMRAKMFGELPGKYAEYAELIHEAGRHLTDLINDVLDMSKIEAHRYTLTREVFDAREAVNASLRLVRLQADEVGVQLRGVLPPQPLIVDADRRAVKQMVLNLVSNALKFTPRGGSITVTARAAAGDFELVVADTGVGIAKQDLERLGRPFEQAGDAEHKAQGTGLGLSLVKAFAQLHGGEMNIESELGEGAAVTVRLPVLVVEEQAPPAPAVAAEPPSAPEPPIAVEAVAPPAPPAAPDIAPPDAPPPLRMAEVIPLHSLR